MTGNTPLRNSAVGLMVLLTATAQARAGEADVIRSCELSAWSTDKDPAGLNVRAGPGTESPIIATIPPPIEAEGYEFAAEVSITGVKDGWFRIRRAEMVDYIGDDDKVVFDGEGWVSGRFLGLELNGSYLRDGPSQDAPVAFDFASAPKDADGLAVGPDSFVVDRLRDCEGDWVEVEGTLLDARHQGWATGTCANQVTTCP